MNLGFIIEQLPITTAKSDDIYIAKGKYKVITKWSEAIQQVKWLLKKK
jgi:hypothetical protein